MHGLIHFMGFAKAFHYGNITQLSKEISKPFGVAWFSTAVIFIIATVMLFVKKEAWPYVAITGVIISQILIVGSWHDAKFGSIANVLILIVAILSLLKIIEW
jgi:hypothetical protein